MPETATTTIFDPLPETATLDGDRADRLGTFLAVEAAADAASTRVAARAPRRRALIGTVAAVVLAGGLLAVSSVVGGPGPAAVDPAVAIEQADGWTTISIVDPDASPAAIEAALDAAGIEAQVQHGGGRQFGPLQVLPGSEAATPAEGVRTLFGATVVLTEGDEDRAFYSLDSFADTEPGSLSGVNLDFAVDDAAIWHDGISVTPMPAGTEGQPVADIEAAIEAMEALGIKTGGVLPAGTVSIKDGTDVKVVLTTR